VVEALARNDGRVRLIGGVEPPPGWIGKPWALEQGSRAAEGELILFADADVRYSPPAVGAAAEFLESSGAALVAVFPRLVMRGFWENVAMPHLALAGFLVVPSWLSNRTKLPILGLGAGTGNLVRADAYRRAGGHERLRSAVVDDVALARLLRRGGEATLILRAQHLVTIRMYRGLRQIIEGFTKNVFSLLGWSGTILAAAWTAIGDVLPYVLALSAAIRIAGGASPSAAEWAGVATVAMITTNRVVLYSALRYSLAAALFAHPLQALVWLLIVLRSAWFVGVRRRLPWRGRSYDARNTRFGESPRRPRGGGL
jgi:hypothetical protein